mmetsp:Transcript_5192/g.11329  ORF Transcript_5192/g.11329 Transcript_5192/m.11329 type:complete len:250 (-) Transcript_5192:1169-1918(-)
MLKRVGCLLRRLGDRKPLKHDDGRHCAASTLHAHELALGLAPDARPVVVADLGGIQHLHRHPLPLVLHLHVDGEPAVLSGQRPPARPEAHVVEHHGHLPAGDHVQGPHIVQDGWVHVLPLLHHGNGLEAAGGRPRGGQLHRAVYVVGGPHGAPDDGGKVHRLGEQLDGPVQRRDALCVRLIRRQVRRDVNQLLVEGRVAHVEEGVHQCHCSCVLRPNETEGARQPVTGSLQQGPVKVLHVHEGTQDVDQ